MSVVKTPNLEPLPGYRLLEPLGRGGFGEVWKCAAPGGAHKAVKFVSPGSHTCATGRGAGTPTTAERELQALEHVKSIRHPFLLELDHVELRDSELIVVMELADRSLFDVLQEHRLQGQPGIPRVELFGYLREVAEVLDLMNLEHGLQHLNLKPRNLFVVGRHVKVADFGLASGLVELCGDAENKLEAISPLYAAPEIFLGKVTLFTDQYSLAVTYQELLTGTLPFPGTHFRQLAMQHLQSEPDLRALPEGDRPAVARALSKDPRQRFPSSTEFVQALEAAHLGRLKSTSLWGTTQASTGQTPVVRGDGLRTEPCDPRSSILDPRSSSGALADYQFLECLVRSPLGEVWKAITSGGRKRLVKYLFGVHTDGGPEKNALDRLRTLRHRMLVEVEYVVTTPGRLAVLTDLPDATLADQLKECQRRGQAGLPRDRLLAYLRQTAEALDNLYQGQRLQHLGLTPRQLVLTGDRLQMTDFGLVELLWLPAGQQPAALNPRYAAPELFEGQLSRVCDQFGLALLYVELLTGVHPFRNVNLRQMGNPRLRGKPDLDLLPGPVRPVVLRALHADPDQRFRTCLEFVEELELVSPTSAVSAGSGQIATLVPGGLSPGTAAAEAMATSLPVLNKLLRELLRHATGQVEIHDLGVQRFRLRPGERIEHQCFAKLLASTAMLKLEGFRQQWQASRVRKQIDHFVFQVRFAGSLWQRCLGRQPGLEADVRLHYPQGDLVELTRILITLQPLNCAPEMGAALLEETGPELLESLRNYLQTGPERRRQERVPFEQTLKVFPVVDGELGEPVVCQARDLSLEGIGLCMPCEPTTKEVCIQLAPRGSPGTLVAVPGRVVHAAPGLDGVYQVGVRFRMPDEKS